MQKQPSHKASLQIRNQRVVDIPGNYNRKYNAGKQFRGTDAPNDSEIFTNCSGYLTIYPNIFSVFNILSFYTS